MTPSSWPCPMTAHATNIASGLQLTTGLAATILFTVSGMTVLADKKLQIKVHFCHFLWPKGMHGGQKGVPNRAT